MLHFLHCDMFSCPPASLHASSVSGTTWLSMCTCRWQCCNMCRLTPASFPVQNRTSASASLPNNQQVYNAYGAYQMLQAAPGQIVNLTWPRTADPDGTVADGSSQLNIYYNPNATINAGAVMTCSIWSSMCQTHASGNKQLTLTPLFRF